MDSLKVSTIDDDEDEDGLDPRIQIELEKLNSATDVINKLEMQLDEANTTFRMLMTDSTRRLKASSSRLGASIVRARPYYEAVELSKRAQQECQRAAVKFQRANEIHQAAKETVALAEARFMSKQHEWQFDNAWQEMLNHATIKVTEAENQKSESGREHQKRALLFNAAEQKVQLLEQRLKRSISKSRPYFEEKAALQSRLDAQKACICQLEAAVQRAKAEYAASLQSLEQISEEIHRRRKDKSGSATPRGPREPGVGAELEPVNLELPHNCTLMESYKYDNEQPVCVKDNLSLDFDLDRCDVRSVDSVSRATSSAVSEADDLETDPLEEDLEELKQRVRELAVRDDVSRSSESWENELTATIDKLDNALLMRECELELRETCGVGSGGGSSGDTGFFSGSSSGINSISAHCDGGDVVNKSSCDVVNQGNVDKRSSGDVKSINEVDVNKSRCDVNQGNVDKSGDVVNEVDVDERSRGDVVKKVDVDQRNSGDVVNQVNINKSRYDVVNQGNVDKRRSGDVVNEVNVDQRNTGNVVNQVDVNKSRCDIVNQEDKVVNKSIGDVVNLDRSCGDVDNQINVSKDCCNVSKDDVDNIHSVVNQDDDDFENKSKLDAVDSGDVVIQDGVDKSSSCDVVSKDDVDQRSCGDFVINKISCDAVNQGNVANKISCDVDNQNHVDSRSSGDVVNSSTDVVN